MAQLTLIRQGQSNYIFENRFTGNTDVELTLFGKEEAEKAGIKLKDFVYTIAYTCVLKRAQETLKIILEVLQQTKIHVVADKAFNERRYGSLQGQNKDEVTLKYGTQKVEIWRRSYEVRPPEG